VEQFVEQLERLVEAEASRAGAAGDDALQLQAPVGGGAHPARHADGARARRRRRYRHGRRSASLRVGGAEQVEWTRNLLAVPLLVKDKAVGVVEVLNKRDGMSYHDEDVALAGGLANLAAVAMDNASLYAKLSEAVVTARMSYRL
jgi:GAF domain-containing protein